MVTLYKAPELHGEHVIVSEVGCPRCASEGNTNIGGNTPRLRFLPSEPRKPFCVGRHYREGNER